MDIIFECKKCGACCKGLFVNEAGLLSGLCFTEDEAQMFDSRITAPYIAIGAKGPEKVVFYQLILANCPNLDERNRCKIYDKRPLICRVFPIKPNLNQVVLIPKCPQIGKFYTGAGEMCPVIIDDAKIEEACKEMNLLLLTIRQECKEKKLAVWLFDLAKQKWVISKGYF